MSILAGDIVFVRGHTIISDAIEIITRSPYSHVALAVSSSELLEAQAGEGVAIVKASKYAGVADVFRKSLHPNELEQIISKAKKHLGEKYDYFLDALEFVRCEIGIQLPYREHAELICSMLIADAFRPEHDPCPGIEYPDPGDLGKSHLWQYVFSY